MYSRSLFKSYPEWITTFQAIHTLGAISAAVNAWSPAETLVHCLKSSGSKVAIMDEDRAKLLIPYKQELVKAGCQAFFTVKKKVVGFESLEEATKACRGATPPPVEIAADVSISPPISFSVNFTDDDFLRISLPFSLLPELPQCQKYAILDFLVFEKSVKLTSILFSYFRLLLVPKDNS